MPDITGVYNGKNKDRHDKWYTPEVAIEVAYEAVTFFDAKIVVFDPFCGDNRIPEYFKKKGIEASGTDIDQGVDFFSLDDDFWKETEDENVVVVTNPPYSLSTKILEKFHNLYMKGIKIKYALLMPLSTLDSRKRFIFFKDLEPTIIIPSRRFQFENSEGKSNDRINFLTCWYTNTMVGRSSDLLFWEVPNGK